MLGNIYIIAAPSGGGKTSLIKQVISTTATIEVSISHTTRHIRPGEQEAVDYFFVNEADFRSMIDKKDFIEYAKVFNHYYGTSKSQIESRLKQGIDVVLDIDWQGAQQIKKIFPEAISVFIIPPSLEILQQRLENRGQDQKEIIQQRMMQAKNELIHCMEFDYLVVNDDFINAAEELRTIILANRLSTRRQRVQYAKLLSILLQ